VFNPSTIKNLQKPVAVGIIPTDTVYGIVARATDQAAVARLYELKKRDAKPGTIVAASIEQLEALGLKHRYLKAVEQFWPGAVSVVIPCADPALAYLHKGQQSLAVRIPDQKDLRQLLQQTGPLLTSSANHPGEPTAVTLDQARAYFKNQVDFYVDGGDLTNHQPSTIIRIVDDAIEILRQGAVEIKS
jgi:tRNA threonylcarbamoyl adenosine modification protein (Sua5/YciO/YrdC/YwlC family)